MKFHYFVPIIFIFITSHANSNAIDGAFGLKLGDNYKIIPEEQGNNFWSTFYPKNKLPGIDRETSYSVAYSPLSKRIYRISASGSLSSCGLRYDLDRIFKKKYGKPKIETEKKSYYQVGANNIHMSCEYMSWANSASFELTYTSEKYYDIAMKELKQLDDDTTFGIFNSVDKKYNSIDL